METENRILPSVVNSELAAAQEYSFFQLNALLGQYCKVFNASHDEQVALRYRAQPSLSFPASDIASANWVREADRDFIELTVTFLGLYGPASPLPVYYTERVIQAPDSNNPSRDLMDLFNHRLVKLLQVCWEKYRYYIQFTADGSDHYSRWLLSLAGVSQPLLRAGGSLQWQRLLPFSGMLAGRCSSADAMAKVIVHYFSVPEVEFEPWVRREVGIQSRQCNQLGSLNSRLGSDLLMGDTLQDCSGKFIIHLKQLPAWRMADFFQNGKDFFVLIELLELLLVDPLDFDLWLHAAEIDPTQQQRGIGFNELGRNLRLGDLSADDLAEPIVICIADYRSV